MKLLRLFSLFLLPALVFSQTETQRKIYNPELDGTEQIARAVVEARLAGKHVLLQIGGNWCVWCHRFDQMVRTQPRLDSILKANYVVAHINYSRENKNEAALAELDYPQRFGFPVLVVLNERGERIHTQDSGLLERQGQHDFEKVSRFLRLWAPGAFDPENYER